MTETLEEFRQKFRLDDLEVASTDHWVWSVRPGPATLGAGVLSLARHAPRFGGLTPEEGADLARAAHLLETALDRTFSPSKINYLMLMMVDTHVHYHVLPRYSGPREFAGMVWTDDGWPGLPTLSGHDDRAGSPVLLAVRDALRGAVPTT
jgi:diadenosine tetraphosphate (Ap4A) HIT family hydrolase